MNGFQAFKYYTAIRLHFQNDKFNVFENRGNLRGSLDRFMQRNDRMLFEKIARTYPDDRECIKFIAANFMYRNNDFVYNFDTAQEYYVEYQRRRQAMTRIFADDLQTIVDEGATYTTGEFSGRGVPEVLQLYAADRITIETLVILTQLDGFVTRVKQHGSVGLILGDDIRRIEKSAGFVKYDPYKVMGPYQMFLEETQGHIYGQDVQTPTNRRV